MQGNAIKAVLGPTNTGKTHLAVERLCAHSSGAIGFPLRLLAREVYERVVAIKGADKVALITGEERIEPAGARWRLCTAEAMDRDADVAFMGIDEAQLGADRERGHVFTDRLLNVRGREETMILGSSALGPMVRALVPEAEIVTRPRFSTLSHAGAIKLSRVPPRSAIVAFSAEQVYVVAEMLRRFRGGAAVVMGALSPQTRNAQVELFQSGEVDYLVATDAIGMGLNLDVAHVAFAGLSKFDGVRRRRLTIAEMAQIAGRAGRHQRDGTFGTLAGEGAEFTPEEIYAIEEHRFAPLDHLFWRDARPRIDSLRTLICDLEAAPDHPALAAAPEAVDLQVAKILAANHELAKNVRGKALVSRFWEACSLPDFRSLGSENHARFVARLWQDLSRDTGRLGHDFVAGKIAELDNVAGDIDTLQGRIAAIRSWSYIAQRPDWVLHPETMAGRARDVEARLSDALHARLTERFVNRRTTVLMRRMGTDAGLLPVRQGENGEVLVDGEEIGRLDGFAFQVDPQARLETRRLLLAAADRHLPAILNSRAEALLRDCADRTGALAWQAETILWNGHTVARLVAGSRLLKPELRLDPSIASLASALRQRLEKSLADWVDATIKEALKPLFIVASAAAQEETGPQLRALLVALVEAAGVLPKDGSGIEMLEPEQRAKLRKLGIRIGALDLFIPAMLKPAPLARWASLAQLAGKRPPLVTTVFSPTRTAKDGRATGYRRAGEQQVRVDLADRLISSAHERRERWTKAGKSTRRSSRSGAQASFTLDPSIALSMGLTTRSYAILLRDAGFYAGPVATLAPGAFGPPSPPRFTWRPRPRKRTDPLVKAAPASAGNPFAGLADLFA
ncbi:helicase-related protein [Croceicoccus sp. F390]|uniref:Helicase-related protein n=1 Tax=Croceicoccus esteveae TaxID=3075597 RepID=A0ABU2ZIK3_9SPHN|nr:helicase-related protein [Croceicoccus sp. F390]MDT0576225.1 helicase-related protein [Croceicoccus sp. F390]